MDIHQQAQEDILNILRRSIYHGENNSALVIGARGSGKTYLINKCLNQIRSELSAQKCSSDVIIVTLSGAVQSDDKSALREITRQLKLGNCVRGKVFGSFGDSFEYLIRSLLAGDNESKPVVFIMDEFDLFTKNKTQLLLYTLLNTIQTATTPMCLIGATCRIDVLDLLEKRIKSRFSHRQIYILNEFDFKTYVQIAKHFLARGAVAKKSAIGKLLDELFVDPQVNKLMERQYAYDKSLSSLQRLLFVAATRLDQAGANEPPKPIRDEMVSAFGLFNMDARASLMTGLSILELTLIVVMSETREAYPDEPFNFELIYNAYLKFLIKKNWGQQKNERQIVLKTYEHLISLKFILPASDSSSSTTLKSSNINKEHTLMVLALEKEEIEECIKRYPNCPTELIYHSRVN